MPEQLTTDQAAELAESLTKMLAPAGTLPNDIPADQGDAWEPPPR
jgi:hypothetical protein